jgi:hypothetical protein
VVKSNVHAILGELYKLLGTYSADDFRQTSNYVGTPRSLKTALRSLANEADASATNVGRKTLTRAMTERPRPDSPRAKNERMRILSLIRRSPVFASTSSIVTFANNLGLKLSPNAKEGRERLAGRLTSLIETLPEQMKNEVLSLLGGRNSQTQGWLDVIKSGKQ